MRRLSRLGLLSPIGIVCLFSAFVAWPQHAAQTAEPEKSAKWTEFQKTV